MSSFLAQWEGFAFLRKSQVGCNFPVAVPEIIFGLTLILDFFDRCHSLTSLYLPLAALGSLPTGLLLRAAFRTPPSIEKKNRPIGQFFFFGAVGGIRTLVPLLTTTRFPVVLVMTSSIPLHIQFAAQHSNDYYTKYLPFVNG